LERIGTSAVVIGDEGISRDDAHNNLAAKISVGKKTQVTADFSIIARINFLHKRPEDTLFQAQEYIAAGADAVMIQGNLELRGELLEFCRLFTNSSASTPLLAALPANSPLTEKELAEAGVQFVVYSDQLLRATYKTMVETAETLLKSDICN
jgi:phosphoenolpyruvate phosphomutase